MKPVQSTESVNKLSPNPWNSNHLSPESESKLEVSIDRLGLFKPIIVRTIGGGVLQILGGQHRWEAAMRMGYEDVPVINLGKISDNKAKEIGLVDNGRYGDDDAEELSDVLSALELSAEELSSFLPTSDADLQALLGLESATEQIDLSDLDPTQEQEQERPRAVPQEFQLMRFKVPVEDVATITAKIDRAIAENNLADSDSLSNAGTALVHLLGKV